jgi:hypothetical protein
LRKVCPHSNHPQMQLQIGWDRILAMACFPLFHTPWMFRSGHVRLSEFWINGRCERKCTQSRSVRHLDSRYSYSPRFRGTVVRAPRTPSFQSRSNCSNPHGLGPCGPVRLETRGELTRFATEWNQSFPSLCGIVRWAFIAHSKRVPAHL